MLSLRWAFAAVWLLLAFLPWKVAAAETAAATNQPPTPAAPTARFNIDVWNPDDGLPGSSVISMVQTRDGYLWLGTLYGLVRFDGIRFTVFDESNTPELNSSPIVTLFEDSRERLWIGTETAGVLLLQDGRITSLGIGKGSGESRLASVAEDGTGAIWLFTADGQLWRYKDGVTNAFDLGTDLPSNYRGLASEPSGRLWFGMATWLFSVEAGSALHPPELPKKEFARRTRRLDYMLPTRDGGRWLFLDGQIQKWRANEMVRDLDAYPSEWWTPDRRGFRISAACEDQSGNLWVGTLGAGLVGYDASGKSIRFSDTNGLSSAFILSLCVDREGTLWVGTDGGGLNRLKRQDFDVLPQSRGWTVQSIAENQRGDLWIGGNDGRIQLWQNGGLQSFGMVTAVRAVYSDKDYPLLVGTIGSGLLGIHSTNSFPAGMPLALSRVVQAIHRDRNGRLWFGTQNGLVGHEPAEWRLFARTNGLSSDDVRAIADDREGNLWIGTRGGGLNRLRDGIFTYFHKHDGLPSEDITSLLADAEGVLWVGTGGGLARWSDGKWTRYTARDGLVSSTVGYLVEDGLGYLWIGSNGGLMRVAKQSLNDFALGRLNFVATRTYRTPDGLPTSECTFGSQPGAIRARDGKLWFPTIKGLVSVDPAQLHPNTNPPPVVIETVLVEGQPQTTNALRAGVTGALLVPPGRERIEIHYTSLNLAAPDAARFKYRLDGHETDWTEAGNIRVARYSKLPPGSYRFQVKACNEDGMWNQTGSSLELVILPPFWRTWWFLALSVAAILGLIVGIVHYFSTQKLQRQLEGMRQQEALEKERARIARDIHDQLGANLTQVAFLSELVETDKDSPTDVEAHARQISQTARDTHRSLDEIVWTVNPSNDTVDGLVTYLCKYAQDYFEVAGLRYRLDVPTELPNTPIAPEVRHNVFLAAKEAITNVVRHAQASAAHLRLRLEPAAFVLEIQDNGRGLSGTESKSTRNGLRNMRKRMEDVGGEFFIGPAPEGGAVVRLTVPFKNFTTTST